MQPNHITHSEIAAFVKDKVILPKDKETTYREQAARLRGKLENYLNEHESFNLRKIITSGSLAKGTALRTLNDIDMACYIQGSDVPEDVGKLIDYLAEKLATAFPNFSEDQIQKCTHSVTVSFRGTGLDVDVVPIIYDNDPNWYGKLLSQDDSSFLKTCIPRHLEFIQARKQVNKVHFSRLVRLVKYWVKKQKAVDENFRFKSFLVELILAKLADNGMDVSDYPEAMQEFFTYIIRTRLREPIIFTDYYKASSVMHHPEPAKIIDPVNAKNNAAKTYSEAHLDRIVNAAEEAGDAIDGAMFATSRGQAISYWQQVLGTTFNP